MLTPYQDALLCWCSRPMQRRSQRGHTSVYSF